MLTVSLQKSKNSPTSVLDMTISHLMELWRVWSTPSLQLLPIPL